MRHGKKINHLGRTDSHRRALLANLASALIKHKRITTTLAKAKALRTYVEPLITKSKNDTTHSRRTVFSYLNDKESVSILFREISAKVGGRPGGYTRIIKLNNRLGDNAEVAMIELVDYNEVYNKGEVKTEKKSTRRRGSKKKSAATDAVSEASQPVADVAEDATEINAAEEDVVEAAVPVAEPVVETAVAEADEKVSDDLTLIEGIGPKIAGVFHGAGIHTFAELAVKSADELKAILAEAGDQFNTAVTDTWAQQAALAAEGKFDELKKWQDELDGGKDTGETEA